MKRITHIEKFNGTSGNGSAFLNRLGWFVSLNLAWLLLAVFTAWLGWQSYTLSVNGEVAMGAVTRLVEEDVSFTSDFYPAVEFTVDGETYSARSQNNYRWWNRYIRFPVGKQVEMRYEIGNPENAEINSWWDVWNETIILGVFTVIAAIGVNSYLFFRWQRSKN